MKRHAIYFALALAGAAFTLQAAPLPAMPDPSLPVSHFITQVNADKVSPALVCADARRVSIVTGATPDSLAMRALKQRTGLDMEKRDAT